MKCQYPRGSVGHILHHLREWGIPERISGSVTVSDEEIFYGNDMFAQFKYFEGIEQPLFNFQDSVYHRQKMELQEDGSLIPQFRLSMYVHQNPSLVIEGHEATSELYEFLQQVFFTSDTRELGYKVRTDSKAFFQGGCGSPAGNYFYIEFYNSKAAQSAVDFINENYRPSKKVTV